MKQIYDFEQAKPPILNENMLRARKEKRILNHQMALLLVGAVLLQVVVLVLGSMTLKIYPEISAICVGYVIVSVTNSCVLAIVYSRKRGLRI